MGFPRRPRPTPTQRDKSSSTSSDSTPKSSTSAAAPSSKRPKLSKDALVFDRQHIRVYIVVAKLEGEEIRRLTQLVEDNGGKCVARVEEATVVLSKTKVWNRLRKYLPERGYVSVYGDRGCADPYPLNRVEGWIGSSCRLK